MEERLLNEKEKGWFFNQPFFVPPAGIEPALMAPEAIALSTELRGQLRAQFIR